MTRVWRVAVAGLVVIAGGCRNGDDPESVTATLATAPVSPPASVAPATASAAATTAPPASTSAATTPETASVPATPPPTQPSTQATTTPPETQSTDAAAAPCGPVASGLTEYELTAGGVTHPVRVFVPSKFSGARLPTVLDWHGLGSNGPQQATLTGYEELAEQEGFVVVHPTGVANAGDTGNSWQVIQGSGGGRDDLAFADALIDEVIANWCADADRIYSTGMSNGGYFTARLVCERADRIAAAVSVAGLFHPPSCSPSRPVPYIAFHGTADTVVPYDGSGESVLAPPGAPDIVREFLSQVIPEEFAEFAADAGCDVATTDTPVGQEVIRHDYTGCDAGTSMAFFEVTGGGHTWPGSPIGDLLTSLLGLTTDDVDATVDGWAFMSRFTLDG